MACLDKKYFKLWKVLKVKVKWIHILPRLELGRRLGSEQQTDRYDSQSMKYLYYILIPLVIGGIYAFGFIFMLPQLFVNYKLKSVSHLPWRAFMYKALNAFMDDVLAFIVTTPTFYHVAVFRDDVVFIIYLCQRWWYPVDMKKVN